MTKLNDEDVRIVVEQIDRIAERRGYQKAIDTLRDTFVLSGYESWAERDGRFDDGTFQILDAREFAAVADYLEFAYPEENKT